MSRLRLRCVMTLVSVACATRATAGEFDALLKRLPNQANTVVVLNVEKIAQSPVAIEGKWKEAYTKNFGVVPMLLPPEAQQFVLASHLDIEFMKPQWEAAVMELSVDPTAEHIAKRVQGSVDRIAGFDVVRTRRDNYIVKFAPKTVGIMSPGNRQEVARWLRDIDSRDAIPLSPYLSKAASFADTVGTEIIMAIDLEDVASPHGTRAVIEESEVLKGKKIDLDKTAALLTSLRGATLGIRVTNRVYGKLKIDFAQDVTPLASVAKALILETMQNAGAAIEEMGGWEAKVDAKQITLEGELTRRGLRRLFSFLELESSTVNSAEAKSTTPAPTSGSSMAYTSLEYFKAVQEYLSDLKHEKSVSIGQIGLWLDKYANKIDRLPILNVDPELVEYGAGVSADLRKAVGAIQGVGIRSAEREAQVQPEYKYDVQYQNFGPVARYGPYGYYYGLYGGGSGNIYYEQRNVSGERRAIRAQEKAAGAQQANTVMAEIQTNTAAMRRTMTEKYKMEF